MSLAENIKILAVIVLYHRNLDESEAYLSLRKNSNLSFYIHSNSADCKLDVSGLGIIKKEDFSNPGVSLAYNRAAEYAIANDFDYILLADQDSTFSDNFFEEFFLAKDKFPQQQIFFPEVVASDKLISPAVFKYSRAWYAIPKPEYGIVKLSKMRPINTGLILDLKLFKKAGGFNPKVFLDYSDFYFIETCLRFSPTGVFFPALVIGELSDFESKSPSEAWERYKLYLKSTKYLAFKSGFYLLPIWWFFKLIGLLKSYFR